MTSHEIGKWDGTITKLKVSDAVYPELHKDLSNIPQRERGERLRLLAYLGLQAIKMGSGAAVGAQNFEGHESAQGAATSGPSGAELKRENGTKVRRAKLMGGL